jgi:hypothetical protein
MNSLKKILFLLTITCFLTLKTQAQHCPFDGASIVIIKVKNKSGIKEIKLKEVDNPKADSCSYAEGLLTYPFQPFDSLHEENSWVKTYEKRYKMGRINKKGDLYVKLNMSETRCMIKDGNDYRYINRHFVISYKNANGELEQIDVPESKIFVMCTSAGSWERFEAIVVE